MGQIITNMKSILKENNNTICVYLISVRNGNQCYIKVGRTRRGLKKRMIEYLQYNPATRLIAYIPTSWVDNPDIEKYYHIRCNKLGFKKQQYSDEWYKVTAEEYKRITTEGFNALG